MEEVKAVIVLSLNYSPGYNPIYIMIREIMEILVLCQNEDYHTVIKDKLKSLKNGYQINITLIQRYL